MNIMKRNEAENIIKAMLEPYGYKLPVLKFVEEAAPNSRYQIGYETTSTKTTGFWWWKKTREVTTFAPVWRGAFWEEVLSKADVWICHAV